MFVAPTLPRRLLVTFDVVTRWYVLALLCGYDVFNNSNKEKKLCKIYFKELFSLIDSPISMIENVSYTLTNLLYRKPQFWIQKTAK